MLKIGNMSFREETISKMTLKDFKDAHKGIKTSVGLEVIHKAAIDKVAESKADVDKPA